MSKNTNHCLLAVAMAAVFASGSAAATDRVDLASLDARHPVDGFLVTYRSGAAGKSADAQRSLAIAARSLGKQGLTLRHERTISTGAELIQASKPLDVVEATTLMQRLAADPAVAFVEPNTRFYPLLTPNDPNYPSQYGLNAAVGGIRANTAWDNTYQGQGKIIAVVDTGITSHGDLAANLTAPSGYDFISSAAGARDGNGRDSNPADQGDWTTAGQCYAGSPATNSSWHGTHVTGIAAAVTNNAVGVAGTAYRAKVLTARALGACGGTLADIADAVTWASGGAVAGVPAVGVNKASVINMSLGGGGICTAGSAMQLAINGAVSRGVTVVVAAGNSNANAANFQPASCANVITVGATGSNGGKASFSNWGALVDVSAPGVSILSTLNNGTTVPGAAAYAYYNGTSMAAPFVAGVVALMQSKPGIDRTPAQAEAIIKGTARAFPVPPPGGTPIGTGIVNADAATDATP